MMNLFLMLNYILYCIVEDRYSILNTEAPEEPIRYFWLNDSWLHYIQFHLASHI